MALASVLALLLQASAPQATAPAAAPAPAPVEEPVPPGAPEDDYPFVAWCYGALSGHMDLYRTVKTELDSLPDPDPEAMAALDAEMLKAGRQYLSLYARAIEAAEKAAPRPISTQGAAAMRLGDTIWEPARHAEPRTRMWSWLSWALPGRCETAAERLYEKSMLAGQARGIDMTPAPVEAEAATSEAAAAPAPSAAASAGLRR